MKFFCVCTKPLYGPEHVYALLKQLRVFYSGSVEMHVYTDRPDLFNDDINVISIDHSLCERQWYKVDFMGPLTAHIDEPIIVMDIDMTIISCIDHLVDIPLNHNEVYAIERWWRAPGSSMRINGGMYKYYPKTCRPAYDLFYTDPSLWQSKYKHYSPHEKVTGEQRFMWEALGKTHTIKTFPGESIIRYRKDMPDVNAAYGEMYQKAFGLPYMRSKGVYHPKVSIIHG